MSGGFRPRKPAIRPSTFLPSLAPALLSAMLGLAGLAACTRDSATEPWPPRDEGQLLVDGYVTIDKFHFSRAACDEVLQEASADTRAIPAGTRAVLEVTSIACYAVDVRVEDTLGREVAAFQRYFDIPLRQDGDKEDGVLGFIAWDGRDKSGTPVPAGRYLWRLDFRFGEDRSVKFRADMRLE